MSPEGQRPMEHVRTLIADDHTILVEGLKKLLEPHVQVLEVVEDGRALIEAVQRLKPDLILVDISMPLLNGIDAARQIKKFYPACKIIFLTVHADPSYATEAFRAGASGFLVKKAAATELLDAIQTVMKGHSYITPLITQDVLEPLLHGQQQDGSAEPHQLTPRQREVLQLVAEGRTAKEIAGILSLSVKTVVFHKTNIMNQLNLHSTAELTRWAMRHGLVTSE